MFWNRSFTPCLAYSFGFLARAHPSSHLPGAPVLSKFSSFGTSHQKGGWGAQRRAKKVGRAEAEIRSVRVEKGAWGGGGRVSQFNSRLTSLNICPLYCLPSHCLLSFLYLPAHQKSYSDFLLIAQEEYLCAFLLFIFMVPVDATSFLRK